jgi:hypothetical protein
LARRLAARRALVIRPYRQCLTQDVRFDDAGTAGLLASRGVTRPTLSVDVLHRLVDQALAADNPRLERAAASAG